MTCFFCEFHHLKVVHFRTFPSPLAHCSLYQTSDRIICQKFQRKALIELWEPKVVIMPRGKQAPPARGEEEASSDDSMSSGFLTHSTLDEQRFTFMFALSRNEFNFFLKGSRSPKLWPHAARSKAPKLPRWTGQRWRQENPQGARHRGRCWQQRLLGNRLVASLPRTKGR